jgi:hypothetical protein
LHDRILNLLWLVSVALNIFVQARCQMPDADQREGDHNGAARPLIEDMPEMRPQHRDEEGREKERDGREDGLFKDILIAALLFEHEVNGPVPARLRRRLAHTLRVNIVGVKNRAARPDRIALCPLRVVEGTLLRVAQRPVGQRKQREGARRLLRATVDIRVHFTRKSAVSRFDFGPGRRSLDT